MRLSQIGLCYCLLLITVLKAESSSSSFNITSLACGDDHDSPEPCLVVSIRATPQSSTTLGKGRIVARSIHKNMTTVSNYTNNGESVRDDTFNSYHTDNRGSIFWDYQSNDEETIHFHLPSSACYQFRTLRLVNLTVQVDGQELHPENDLMELPQSHLKKDTQYGWYVGDCSPPNCGDDHALFELEIATSFFGAGYYDWMIREVQSNEYIASCSESSENGSNCKTYDSSPFQRARLCLPLLACYEMIFFRSIGPYTAYHTKGTFDGKTFIDGILESQSLQFGTACSNDDDRASFTRMELFYFDISVPLHTLNHVNPSFDVTNRTALTIQYQILSNSDREYQQEPHMIQTTDIITPINNVSYFYYMAVDVPTGSCIKMEAMECLGNEDELRVSFNGSIYAENKRWCRHGNDDDRDLTLYVGDDCRYCTEQEALVEIVEFIPKNSASLWWPHITDWQIYADRSLDPRSSSRNKPNGKKYSLSQKYMSSFCIPRDSCSSFLFYVPHQLTIYRHVSVDGARVPPNTVTTLSLTAEGMTILPRVLECLLACFIACLGVYLMAVQEFS